MGFKHSGMNITHMGLDCPSTLYSTNILELCKYLCTTNLLYMHKATKIAVSTSTVLTYIFYNTIQLRASHLSASNNVILTTILTI